MRAHADVNIHIDGYTYVYCAEQRRLNLYPGRLEHASASIPARILSTRVLEQLSSMEASMKRRGFTLMHGHGGSVGIQRGTQDDKQRAKKCSLPGSNWRPSDYETDALPTEPKEQGGPPGAVDTHPPVDPAVTGSIPPQARLSDITGTLISKVILGDMVTSKRNNTDHPRYK